MNNKNIMPTQEEIDACYAYYAEKDEKKAYIKYIVPIVAERGSRWTDILLSVVLNKIIEDRMKKKK